MQEIKEYDYVYKKRVTMYSFIILWYGRGQYLWEETHKLAKAAPGWRSVNAGLKGHSANKTNSCSCDVFCGSMGAL